MPDTRIRVGLIVPSSNVTVETELPALLGRHSDVAFSFHASRMRMASVSPEELAAMNAQRDRCVDELGDARPNAVLYACLVALMTAGDGEHRRVEALVDQRLAGRDRPAAVRSSAGALVEALKGLGARRIALVTPYMRPLAERVVGYLTAEGFSIVAWRALEVADNHAVGCIPGETVLGAARSIDLADTDALVISACVQMPSLALVDAAEQEFGLPVISAATASAYSLLRALGLPVALDGVGSLLRAG